MPASVWPPMGITAALTVVFVAVTLVKLERIEFQHVRSRIGQVASGKTDRMPGASGQLFLYIASESSAGGVRVTVEYYL